MPNLRGRVFLVDKSLSGLVSPRLEPSRLWLSEPEGLKPHLKRRGMRQEKETRLQEVRERILS